MGIKAAGFAEHSQTLTDSPRERTAVGFSDTFTSKFFYAFVLNGLVIEIDSTGIYIMISLFLCSATSQCALSTEQW